MNAATHPGDRIAWLRISSCGRPRGPAWASHCSKQARAWTRETSEAGTRP